MKCKYCTRDAIYRCNVCGNLVCDAHVQLRTVCASCVKKNRCDYSVRENTKEDRNEIRRMVKLFWGEPEQLVFDKKYVVDELPAFIAESTGRIVGFLSYAELGADFLTVALGVTPNYQGAGIGRRLVQAAENKAETLSKKRMLVSTSNDDLPALAFYQSLGFQIFEVNPNIVAEKHGGVLPGIGGIPLRDELRLQKIIHNG
ncbi:MAG: GNAT family N-acetyltransferase [Thermoproteota archaeon]|nr:GNAT family N-acetyltransferase [Thermoproteota archaeon]